MAFWIFMLVTMLLIPVSMAIFGSFFKKRAPKEINMSFGYRTTMSMKNQDTWEFAHKHIGRLWLIIGIALTAATVVTMLFSLGKTADEVGAFIMPLLFVQLICLITPIFFTENALKKNFDADGRRKSLRP